MNKLLKLFLLCMSFVLVLIALTGCFEKNEEVTSNPIDVPSVEENKVEDEEIVVETNSLKINSDEAINQVIVALTKMYTTDSDTPAEEVRVDNVKIYSTEEEQDPILEMYTLGPNDVAFEVQYAIKPFAGTDPNIYTAGSGVVKGEWVEEKYNVGILRSEENGEYKITDFGTGF